jgi:hypothetical protein
MVNPGPDAPPNEPVAIAKQREAPPAALSEPANPQAAAPEPAAPAVAVPQKAAVAAAQNPIAPAETLEARRLHYRKALQRLLLFSTAGAFFFALARNLPIHAMEFSWSFQLDYTLDRILRYFCLTWFLAYFFVSSVNNDLAATQSRGDIPFDVFQSLATLAAVYTLGFVNLHGGYGFDDGLRAFQVAYGVVFSICLISLLFGGQGAVQGTRMFGAAVSLAALAAAATLPQGTFALAVLLVLQLLLWVTWGIYFRLRVNADD